MLPSVYLTVRAEPSPEQRSLAALLYAGDDAALDGMDACVHYGLRSVRKTDADVRIVVPWENRTRNVWFLDVRRTSAPITTRPAPPLRYVDPATAAIAHTRQLRSERQVLAVLSEIVQRNMATYEELVASPILPAPLYNCLLRLPCGRLVSPDALFIEAGLVHETNGRSAHGREDLFQDMQARHDVMTAAGLTVLHNPPRRLVTRGREAIGEVERCYQRLAGRGLPAGVEIVRLAG